MNKMKVLIACEFSGVVREAFRRRGHDAWSCDLLPTDSGLNHYQCDIFEAFEKQAWDFVGIHAPCTAIALCGNSTYGNGMPKHHMRIASIEWTKRVWQTAISRFGKVYFENPKNVMGAHIGKHTQKIQPYGFGHLECKETWLWLHGLPCLTETHNVYEAMMKFPKAQRERIHYMSPSANRGHERSRTFQGVADAMAAQWG